MPVYFAGFGVADQSGCESLAGITMGGAAIAGAGAESVTDG